MKTMLRIGFCIWLCFTAAAAHGQCDTVYTPEASGCAYTPGQDSLMRFMKQQLIPVLQKLPEAEKQRITKLLVVMTVDAQGKIIDIHLPHFTGPPSALQELKKRIAAMQGWSTGQVNGKAVCTEVFWGMNCVVWE
ncbi:MAG: hypothetical protein MUC87_08550 [Bacteroidia bacterium]|jgi:hypothetical protein|nr:hypothetical protein [Bacteroidia bacterium]